MEEIKLTYNQPEMEEYIISHNQDTDDIISAILNADNNNPALSYDNAVLFMSEDDYKTGLNIFNYIKDNIYYQAEPDSSQTTKTIDRILTDQKGDCKHYSLFAGSVLKTLGIPYVYRFVSFGDKDDLTHVYIVINPDTNPLYLDGVIDEYNTQEPYKYKEDYYPKNKKIGKSIGATDPEATPVYVNWAEIVIDLYNDMPYLLVEEKKGKHTINKILPVMVGSRLIAKNQVLNEAEKYKPAAAMWLAGKLANYNQNLYNTLFGDSYQTNGTGFLLGWENFKRDWYNLGGNKDEHNSTGLPAYIVNWAENNITNNTPIYQLTATPELIEFFNEAIDLGLESEFTGVDENAPEPVIQGVGFVWTAALVAAIISAVVGIIIASMEFITNKKNLEFAQDQVAAQQQQEADYLEWLQLNAAQNDNITANEDGIIPAYIDPLAIGVLAFGGVLVFSE